ncbi:hypothetical protein ACFL6H_09055 [Candidatus Latescibacterota bacterium]
MIRGYQVIAYLKIIALAALITALWTTAVVSDDTAPRILIPEDSKDVAESGIIKAQVHDDTQVSNVTLFYRKTGEDKYKSVDMKLDDDIYYRELKKELGMNGSVEYYLLAQDTSGNESTLPDTDPQGNPLTALSDGSVNVSADEVVLGSPTPGMVYDTGDQLVMITFYRTGRQIDYGTIRLRIDEVDRTREADLIGNTLMWEPRRPLTDGEHKIEAIVKDLNGDPIGPNVWTFTVKSRIALPLGAEGDFYMGIQHDDRSSNVSNVPLWNNKIDLGLRGETGFLSWKAGAMLSSEETAFLTSEKLPDRQPINRFFIEGRSRHFKIRYGDSNPTFSDLSLKGIRVRGLDVEFKSNRFNTNFIYGSSKRDIDETINIIASGYYMYDSDTYISQDNSDTLSTASNNLIALDDGQGGYNIYTFSQGSPKRDVIALKVDVAPMRNKWATWKIGFNFFGAEDDTTTVNYEYDPNTETRSYRLYNADRDSSGTLYTDYKPKKNWVGTVLTSLLFNDNKSEISAEFGATIVTENLFSYVTADIQEELDKELPDALTDEIFLINGSTQTSFDKSKLSVADALTSVYSFKLKTAVPIPFTKTRFTAEAYKTPTHYVSLGNPQQKTDIVGYKFDMQTRILRDQLSFKLGYNTYADNLAGERKQYADQYLNQMDLTKDTSTTNFSVSLNPSRWQDYSPSVSVGYRMYTSQNDLNLKILDSEGDSVNDTTSMIDTATNTLMLSFGGVLPVGLQRHSGMLSISNMAIVDNRPVGEFDLNESDNMTVMFNLNSQVNPLPVSIAASVGYTTNNAYILGREVTTGISLFNVAGTYKWFRDKRLKTTAGFGYIGSSNGEDINPIDNNKISLKMQADYRITSISSIGAEIRYITYTDNTYSINDYTEPIIGFNLRSTF